MRPSQHFDGWIREQVQAHKRVALPPSAQLAASFGISKRTVDRILKRYRQRGEIIRIPGRGTFIGGAGDQTGPAPDGPLSSAESVERAIIDDIASGKLKNGDALPSHKYMCLQFGLSQRTVRTAYESLERRRLATRIGKRYFVGREFTEIQRSHQRGEIVLFGHEGHDFSYVFSGNFLCEACRTMERELFSNRYIVRYESIDDLRELYRTWMDRRRPPHGIIFFATHQQGMAPAIPLMRKLFAVPQRNRPNVLVDWVYGDTSCLNFPAIICAQGHILTSSTRELCSFIVEKGYRRVRFVQDVQTLIWNNSSRLAPVLRLRNEFRERGIPFPVTYIVCGMDRECGIEEFLKTQSYLDPVTVERKWYTFDDFGIDDALCCTTPADLADRFSDTDLWIASTSAVARELYGRIEKRGKRVPGDCAIVSLENDPHHYHYGFTWCGPDWERIGYLMAHALMGDIPIARTSKGFLRTSGTVIRKLTT